MSSIVSLTKQQVAVYKMTQKPTSQNKVLGKLRFPETRPFVEQKSSEAFPVKSVVVNPKLLIEALGKMV